MTDELDLLSETTTGLLQRSHARSDPPEALWKELDSAGLLGIGVPESCGGSGGDLVAAAQVVRCCARFPRAAQLPIGNTLLLAHWLREAAGLPVDLGPTVVTPRADVELRATHDGFIATGFAARVSGACHATRFLILARDSLGAAYVVSIGPDDDQATLSISADSVRRGLGLGRIDLEDVPLQKAQVHAVPAHLEQRIGLRAQLLTTVHLSGVLDEVLDLTLRYANERQQFGRSIADFQMVKQKLAHIAGEVAIVGAASDGAVAAIDGSEGILAVPAARLRAGRAATTVARLAHQVHGAIGVAAENPLHRFTSALWHWRDVDGNEVDGHRKVGRMIAARGADAFWPAIVGE